MASKQRHGTPRLQGDLRDEGERVARRTISKCMKSLNLRAKASRRFRVTTDSDHALPVAPNRIRRDFTAHHLNEKWVADVTYLWTHEGWMYLAIVLDVCSRKVIGWSLQDRMTAKLVCDALTMALWRRRRPSGVIVHTDRGSQYSSEQYRRLTEDHGLLPSMGSTGSCYDNAMAESFFHSFKVEAIHGERITTKAAMKRVVFEYIEVDYNRRRRHSGIGYISPDQFEQQLLNNRVR